MDKDNKVAHELAQMAKLCSPHNEEVLIFSKKKDDAQDVELFPITPRCQQKNNH